MKNETIINETVTKRAEHPSLKQKSKHTETLYQNFLKEETEESFSVFFQNLISLINSLIADNDHILGASKLIEDNCHLFRKWRQEKHHVLLESGFSAVEANRILDESRVAQRLKQAHAQLLYTGERFQPKALGFYRTLLYSKEEVVALQQAEIRLFLSYYSEEAGKEEEVMRYKAEAEQILMKYAQEKGLSPDALREKHFPTKERMLQFIQNMK